MKTNLSTKFAILTISLAATVTAFADVKIKSQQKVSGQTMENTVLIKGKRERTESMNGKLVSIMQCDLRRDIKINPASQTYQISLFDTGASGGGQTVDAKNSPVTKGGVITMLVSNKDTGERKQMFGYTARHIISTMEMSSSPDACSLTKSKMQIDGWYIDADFALDCAANRVYGVSEQQKGGCQDKTEIKTVGAAIKKGYPVLEKMTMFDENGKESFTTETEVVELSKANLDANLFDVPADYREVKSTSELYAGNTTNGGNNSLTMPNAANGGGSNGDSGMNQTVKNLSQNSNNSANEVGAKKDGTVRIGLANVKVGAVGEGINAAELAGAIQNTLGEYLKGSRVELVPLEAKLASALGNEAKEKQCDFVLYATVSHKKGGGGMGMFGKIAPVLGSVVPMAGMAGGMAGAVAGSVASTAISTAAGATSNVKAKDELTLDLKIQNGASVAFTKQYKAKAKSAGEDIISPLIEQAAQAIIDAVVK